MEYLDLMVLASKKLRVDSTKLNTSNLANLTSFRGAILEYTRVTRELSYTGSLFNDRSPCLITVRSNFQQPPLPNEGKTTRSFYLKSMNIMILKIIFAFFYFSLSGSDHTSMKCSWPDDIQFRKANILNGAIKFWWAEGNAANMRGESYVLIQKWFDSVERPPMLALESIFSKITSPQSKTFLDIGSHQGWFSQVAGSYGVRAIGFDMQRMCVELYKCSSVLNNFWNNKILNVYVTNTLHASKNATIMMSPDICVGGTSPSATGGGSNLIPIPPLDITNFLSSHELDIPLIKIDTEGYEAIILDGILATRDSTFARIGNFIIEVTPGRWKEFGLSTEDGFKVYEKLFAKQFQAMFLPETKRPFSVATALNFTTFAPFESHVREIKGNNFRNYWFFRASRQN